MRIEAEHGACAGKRKIATRAKELGYDAIHEMCKDKAHHGQVFSGLLAQSLLRTLGLTTSSSQAGGRPS